MRCHTVLLMFFFYYLPAVQGLVLLPMLLEKKDMSRHFEGKLHISYDKEG